MKPFSQMVVFTKMLLFLKQTAKGITQNNGLMQNVRSALLVPFFFVLNAENSGRWQQEFFITSHIEMQQVVNDYLE